MLPARPFYLIRHGQTIANAARITAGGETDTPLNEKGRQQAQTLASYLGRLDIAPAIIYHSEMSRSRDTAQFLNKNLNLELRPRFDLREHVVGEWAGQSWDIIEPLMEADVDPPGGETYAEFAARVQIVFTEILNTPANGPPMIVAHGGVFHSLGFLYEYAMSDIQNCHLHYFEPNPEWEKFPWRVSCFDIEDEKLVKRPAVFCFSQKLEKIS